MSETVDEERIFRSELFATEPFGDEGEADGYPTLGESGVDQELQHPNWASELAGRQLVGAETSAPEGVVSYGYRVYRDLLEEDELPEAVYLDPRSFFPETDLVGVLNEAAKTAIAYEHTELVAPIMTGMIHTVAFGNSAGARMSKYLGTAMSSVDARTVQIYVKFMNENTPKRSDWSKRFLKRMADAVQTLPEKGMHRSDPGLWPVEKQVLLEDIGHAWIRKALPVAEIDWLP